VAETFKLPTIRGATWDDVVQKYWDWARGPSGRGVIAASNEVIAPKLTNREAAALISEMRALAPMTKSGFQLWYQFAAEAYGWSPKRDKLDVSKAQEDRMYGADAGLELSLALFRMTSELNDDPPDAGAPEAVMEFDQGAFQDTIFQSDVIRALKEDGAEAFLIPSCERDGKKGQFPKRNKDTNEWECENPDVFDPTAPLKKVVQVGTAVAIIAGLVYLFAPAALSGVIAGHVSRNSRRGRRTRRH